MDKAMYEQLFPYLDANEQCAWERYGTICCKLITFFENKKTVDPVECLEKTLNRVLKKINEGKIIDKPILDKYFLEVARFIYLEEAKKCPIPIKDLREREIPPTGPEEEKDENRERLKKEQRLDCLDKCKKKLPKNEQELIIDYYKGEGKEKIKIREKLAKKLNITINALRIKANRIRVKLRICVDNCLEQTTPGEWIKLLLGNNRTIIEGFDYE